MNLLELISYVCGKPLVCSSSASPFTVYFCPRMFDLYAAHATSDLQGLQLLKEFFH